MERNKGAAKLWKIIKYGKNLAINEENFCSFCLKPIFQLIPGTRAVTNFNICQRFLTLWSHSRIRYTLRTYRNIRADDVFTVFLILHECYFFRFFFILFRHRDLPEPTHVFLQRLLREHEPWVYFTLLFQTQVQEHFYQHLQETINIPIFVLSHLRNYKKQRPTKSSKLFGLLTFTIFLCNELCVELSLLYEKFIKI